MVGFESAERYAVQQRRASAVCCNGLFGGTFPGLGQNGSPHRISIFFLRHHHPDSKNASVSATLQRGVEHMSNTTRTAIVTGASKGIGAAVAKRLAADGFQTIVNYASSVTEAMEVVGGIEALGGRARAVRADVADGSAVRALFDEAEREYGPVDVLVNNAGVIRTAPLAAVQDEDYQRLIAVNLTGTFNGMREASRRVRDGGRIINLSTSIIGYYLPNHGVYAATKAAVEAMTHVLAKELGSRSVTVNAIAPGPVATELFLTGRSDDLIQRLTKEIPLGRLGQPDDVARVVSFLASPESGWINGQVLKVNGGRN
jgi:3-oxoacyl-[acyl-carrier protein] reductase